MSSTDDLLDGRYRLGDLIGRGGMSDVFRATDEQGGDLVAVKVVRSADGEYATRLSQEARALRRFEHPGLVRLLDSGVTGDMAYLVMEYVDGVSLAETLRRGPLTPTDTANLGAALADGLAYVHERGVVHRDVKPANILIDTEGRARLADFGIARLVDTTTLTVVGTTLGTASYMAPEQLEDHQVGPGADVWSLGIVLLECLTGQRVYSGTPSEVIARRLAGPVPLPPSLPVPWKTLFGGMLDHRPDQRLRAAEVSALLATSAFRSSWAPAVAAVGTGAMTEPYDLTALSEPRGDETALALDHTVIIPPHLVSAVPRRAPNRRWIGLAALLILPLIAFLAFGLGSNGDSHPTTTVRTTTSTVPPTTTTVPSSVPQALTTLLTDLASGEATGAVTSGSGPPISDQAQQAVIDSAAGSTDLAVADLQQVAYAITNGVNTGAITPAVGSLLTNDLTALATALGLNSSPATTVAPVPSGHGHGKGNKP